MALPKNNTSGASTAGYSGPGAGVKIMQSDDPIAAAKAANEAYRAAQASGTGPGISPTYYNPTVPTQTAKTTRDLSYSTPGQIDQYMRSAGAGSLTFENTNPDTYLGPRVAGTGQGGRSAALRDRASKLLGIPINPNISDQALITMLTQFNEQTPYAGIAQGTPSMDAIDQLLRIAEGTGIQSFADGGRVSRPTVALVGENGPELAMLQSGDLILPLPKKQSKKVEKMPGIPKMQNGGMIEDNTYFGGGPGRTMRGGPDQPLDRDFYLTGELKEVLERPGVGQPLEPTMVYPYKPYEQSRLLGDVRDFAGQWRFGQEPNLRVGTRFPIHGSPTMGEDIRFEQTLGVPDYSGRTTPQERFQASFVPQTYMGQQRGLPSRRPATGQTPWDRLGINFDDGQYVDPRITATQTLRPEELLGVDPTATGVLPPTPDAAPVAPAMPPRVVPTAAQQLQTTGDFGGINQTSAVQEPITAGRSVEEQFLSPSELRNQPMYQTADASGMDTGAYLDAAFKGELAPEMVNEALSVRADLLADYGTLDAEIDYLEGLDKLDDAQKLKLTELRKDREEARSKWKAVNDVITEAGEINSAAMTRGQLLEDAARTRAEQLEDEARAQAEKERLEYADEMKQAEQLQIERAGMREQRQYAQQQQQDMANSVRQLFGSLGINLPEGSLAGISPEMMPQILQMLFSMQRQQYAPPTVARFGFA